MWNVEKSFVRHQLDGKLTVRQADGGMTIRDWKKQRLFCNGVDRSMEYGSTLNLSVQLARKGVQTSNGCSFVRKDGVSL